MKRFTARLVPLLLAILLLFSACGKSGGSGAVKKFTLEITHSDGGAVSQEIETDKATVGEALQALGLIGGEEGGYGLYVTTVDGETVKYEDGGHYWAFYINGEYAATGVDATEIDPGAVYAFRVE